MQSAAAAANMQSQQTISITLRPAHRRFVQFDYCRHFRFRRARAASIWSDICARASTLAADAACIRSYTNWIDLTMELVPEPVMLMTASNNLVLNPTVRPWLPSSVNYLIITYGGRSGVSFT